MSSSCWQLLGVVTLEICYGANFLCIFGSQKRRKNVLCKWRLSSSRATLGPVSSCLFWRTFSANGKRRVLNFSQHEYYELYIFSINWTITKYPISIDIYSGISTVYSHRVNKELSSKFSEGFSYWQTPEEGRRAQWSKRCNRWGLRCSINSLPRNSDRKYSLVSDFMKSVQNVHYFLLRFLY